MDLPEVKPVLAKDFVACWIDTDRMIGGADFLKKVRGGDGGGIPWFSFMEADGTQLITSDTVFGSNLGCPHTEKEVGAWGETIRRVKGRIPDVELDRVIEAFHEVGERGEKRRKAEQEAKASAGQ